MNDEKDGVRMNPSAVIVSSMSYFKRIFISISVVLSTPGIGTTHRIAAAETAVVPVLPQASRAAKADRVLPATPRPVPHLLERDVYYKYCGRCHGAGKMKPFPADHSGYDVKSCSICHKPDSTSKVGESGAVESGMIDPGPIPHPVEENAYEDCVACHGAGKMKPFPADHSAYDAKSCLSCHKPGSASKAVEPGVVESGGDEPGPIPHPVEEDAYEDCATCHGAGKMKPFPETHSEYTRESCAACHKPDPGGI